jgi:hypothetical protein
MDDLARAGQASDPDELRPLDVTYDGDPHRMRGYPDSEPSRRSLSHLFDAAAQRPSGPVGRSAVAQRARAKLVSGTRAADACEGIRGVRYSPATLPEGDRVPETPSDARPPNAQAERALAALERWAAGSDRPLIVLSGAAETGKTVLLDVFAARSERAFSVVYLLRPGSDPDALSSRILAALGQPVVGTPRLVLGRWVQRAAARPLLLLLDDADTLSPRVEMWLYDLARRSGGGLRVVLALSDSRLARELALAFRADTEIVSLSADMDRTEAEAYLQLIALRASQVAPAKADPAADATQARATTESRDEPAPTGPDDRRPAPFPQQPSRLPAPPASPSLDSSSHVSAAPPRREPAPASGATERTARGRWFPVGMGLTLSFVAGFAISELLEMRRSGAPGTRTGVDVSEPLAELPPVSAAPAAAPPPRVEREPVNPLPPPAAAQSSVEAGKSAARAAAQESGVPSSSLPERTGAAAASPPSPRAEGPAGGTEQKAALDRQRIGDSDVPSAATGPPPGELDPDSGEPSEPLETTRATALESERAPAPPAPARPQTVSVQIRAAPGTEIEMGGRSLGAAPVEEFALPPGEHRLLARLPDGREVERIVEVRGTRYEIQIR